MTEARLGPVPALSSVEPVCLKGTRVAEVLRGVVLKADRPFGARSCQFILVNLEGVASKRYGRVRLSCNF